ncbi:MAG: hypothetical protein GX488_03455, partial [Clostridiales bacterium]|nr:hypothetical protein [Clostridiales bacterium]
MKTKAKILSFLLMFAIMLSLLPAGAFADGTQNSINAYVTISIKGSVTVGTDNSGNLVSMALVPVEVTDR